MSIYIVSRTTIQVRETPHFDKYLGFQMHIGRIKREEFDSIVDKVSNKLAYWKVDFSINWVVLFLLILF